ncbi:MAG: type III-A CRISPR-associated RAMP protein Csm4, partial [bacterium]
IISGASYDLLMRRGWAYSRALNKSYRRKNCRMFKEGSVFSNKTKGRILDITPDNYNLAHKIYRFGISLDVPVKRGDNNDI